MTTEHENAELEALDTLETIIEEIAIAETPADYAVPTTIEDVDEASVADETTPIVEDKVDVEVAPSFGGAESDEELPPELLAAPDLPDVAVPKERSAMEDVSDEEIDALADAAIGAIHEVLKFFPVSDYTIEEYEGDEGELILDIVGEDLNILIGRHGRTAEALQVVVSAIASRGCNVFYPITVDVEGYKHRRKQRVIEIAQKVVDRVRDTGRPVSLKPMTPAERRQVHMSLREVRGVTTTSEGSGSYRHVVVLPVE